MNDLLVIMTKEPVPGQVKTRLIPPLTAEEAADLYEHFLQDRLKEMDRISDIDKAIAFEPKTAEHRFKTYGSRGYHLFPQRGNNLGDRMYYIFEDMLEKGYNRVVIIGCDSPDLPISIILESIQLLSSPKTDLVLGPAKDGGYYLIGMKKPYTTLFKDIVWGTNNVFSETLSKAEALDIHAKMLSVWSDIDTREDILQFFNKYKDQPDDSYYPGQKTMTYLRKHATLIGLFSG